MRYAFHTFDVKLEHRTVTRAPWACWHTAGWRRPWPRAGRRRMPARASEPRPGVAADCPLAGPRRGATPSSACWSFCPSTSASPAAGLARAVREATNPCSIGSIRFGSLSAMIFSPADAPRAPRRRRDGSGVGACPRRLREDDGETGRRQAAEWHPPRHRAAARWRQGHSPDDFCQRRPPAQSVDSSISQRTARLRIHRIARRSASATKMRLRMP